MAYRVERALEVDLDLEDIFSFIFTSFVDLGTDAGTAFENASARIVAIEEAMEKLGEVPHQGTLRPELAAGLRNVTKQRAIFYFYSDDDAQVVRVLAVFYGSQDHQHGMLIRLLQ